MIDKLNTKSIYIKQQIANHFGQANEVYDTIAVLQQQVGQELINRLKFLGLQANVSLDVGAGTGALATALISTMPQTQLILSDIAFPMVNFAKTSLATPNTHYLCSDAEAIPIANDTVDLIISNMTFQWCPNPKQLYKELFRVLKPEGRLLFSTVGPATLYELKASWAEVNQHPHVNDFIDMHNIGDDLLATGFSEPVMDAEQYTLTYHSVKDLLVDLKQLGSSNTNLNKSNGLVTANQLNQLAHAYEAFRRDDILPATYEIVFGYAKKIANQTQHTSNSEVTIPIDSIRRKPS